MESNQSALAREACNQPDAESFPALRQLGLGDEELNSLRNKGYLTQDDRGHGHAGYWRLRFRHDRRTRTVYLGRDAGLVARVQQELSLLQTPFRLRRQCTLASQEGSQLLRDVKKRLGPLLQEIGFHYHGDTLRKTRGISTFSK